MIATSSCTNSPPGQMNGHGFDVFGRFHDALRHRRMRMDGLRDRVRRRTHVHRHRGLMDQIGGMGADQMDADDLLRLCIRDDLHQTGGFPDSMSLPQADGAKSPYL